MYLTNLLGFLVLLFELCHSDDQSEHNPIAYANVYDKYCALQTKNCNHTLHPLCAKFNPIHYPVEHYIFYELDSDDIDFILTTINAFRNDLAAGNIAGQKSGSNIRVVKWSYDYASLLKAKLLYHTVCTEISFTNQITLEMEQFTTDDDNSESSEHFFRGMFLQRVRNDSTSKSPWIDIFRAEFDLIGCVHYEDDEYDSKTFACYVNRYGPRDAKIQMDTLYQYGKPCSECDGECSLVWTSLCDDSIQKPPSAWNNNMIAVYTIICGCAVLLFVVVLMSRLMIKRRNRNTKSVKIEMVQQ